MCQDSEAGFLLGSKLVQSFLSNTEEAYTDEQREIAVPYVWPIS
jgi:hypothetical protein